MKLSFIRLLLLGLLLSTGAKAQMPHDAIYMSKGQVCVAALYGQSSWNQYWEGTLKRPNLNIGTHTTHNVMLMPAIGLSNRFNLILSLPYVWTQTSAGNLMGQRGIQDLAVWGKYRAVAVGGFSLHAVAGASLPLGNYVPDFLPMSIGLQCRTATGRLIASYRHRPSGLYLTGHGSYTWRSNIRVDRDAYQADGRVYNTNEVRVPNAFDWGARLGVLRSKWQTEVWAEHNACTSGDNIRRNDMPFPTNNMQATMVGWYGKVQPRNIGVNARIGYVVDGLNMGQSTSYMVGVLYQFKVK
ncbi:hypothetical protein [Tellurirhabdus rosea]|uniref:hypothetical protein n=1 Tax=Tellurirhabdus rosea TaxID=2674997 RepID=UPI0022592E95|nr:hypothetical protein [Tellurirhabdus rosea]